MKSKFITHTEFIVKTGKVSETIGKKSRLKFREGEREKTYIDSTPPPYFRLIKRIIINSENDSLKSEMDIR